MYSEIYWLTRLDVIIGFLIAICLIAGFAALMVTIHWHVEEDFDKSTGHKKVLKRLGLAIGISSFLLMFIPSKDDLILIVAGGKTYEYIQSDSSLQKIPYRATQYMKVLLEKEINEIKEK